MEIIRQVIERAYECFQWQVPILNCSMWQIEIGYEVGCLAVVMITELFRSDD